MIIVVLNRDDVINGAFYAAGQRARVPDNYDNIRRVVGRVDDVKSRNQQAKGKVLLPKILARLAELPAWEHLPDKKKQEIIDKLLTDPSLLGEAIKNYGELLKNGR